MNSLPVTFPLLEHIDYYEYLIKVSWPALCGLLVIYLFLGLRFFQAIKRTTPEKHDLRKRLSVISRLVVTVIVLSVYTEMFVQGYGDWLDQPSMSRGVVESLDKNEGVKEDFFLTLKDGEESIKVSITKLVHDQLSQDDLVEIEYLPRKKEVFRCIILTQ